MFDGSEYVVATYREIAERFQLGDPRAARTKAKRAGWVHEPVNHPADPRRVRVPLASWEQAGVSPRARRRSDSPSQAVQTPDEYRGSSAQKNERGGTEPGCSGPETQDGAQAIKTDPKREHRASKRQVNDDERKAEVVKDVDAVVAPLREQLDRERARADASETRTRELTDQVTELREQLATANATAAACTAQARGAMTTLEAIRENETRLREQQSAAIAAAAAKAEAAETRVDDLKAEARKEGEGRARAEAKAEMLQAELDRLKPLAHEPAAQRRGILRRLFGRKNG
jgi:hypothetical protein